MTWARFIAKIESDLPATVDERITLDMAKLRSLLVQSFTEGYGEGRKQRRQEDTHVLIKFLRAPNSDDCGCVRGTKECKNHP